MKYKITDEQVKFAAETANSATAAAALLGVQYGTYRRHAIRLGVFKTNQSGKGMKKPILDSRKIPLDEILNGKHPSYQSNKLRKRLLDENIKTHICEVCGLTEWMNKPIPLEVDHIDGIRNNHILSNLRLICPNCHAQTDTYKGKNMK